MISQVCIQASIHSLERGVGEILEASLAFEVKGFLKSTGRRVVATSTSSLRTKLKKTAKVNCVHFNTMKMGTRCLKIREKVSFNIASEASLHFEWTKIA